MRTHITHVLSSCYSALREIRSIMRSLSSHALNALVTALVHSRLDYCNIVFAGLPACDIQRLQSVLNIAVHWWPAHRDVIMHSLCCATVIGCLFSSASSTNCAWWSTGACTATLRPTCWTWSRRLLMQPSEVVSDRLHPAQLQCHEQFHRSATAHSAAVFKRQLKTFLFDRAFNWHYIARRPCCALALTSP